jgi:arsenite methyltransferase
MILAEKPTDSPAWLERLVGAKLPAEGGHIDLDGIRYIRLGGILRSQAALSDAQAQTSDAFGFKWHLRDTFDRPEALARTRQWLVERYGEVANAPWLVNGKEPPILLDAGCGSSVSAVELFGGTLKRVHYLGIDVSNAVNMAYQRMRELGLPAQYIQVDLMTAPLPKASVDVIFSEGVLHHADSTEAALKAMASLLKRDGRFLFYVYRRKGPIREYTDDYIRERLREMPPQEAWDALRPLTEFGKALGELDIEIEVPKAIELLKIPAGKINLQRFIYWHVFKAFHHPSLNIDEMQNVNFDWYAPKNSYRQSPEEVRAWCAQAGLTIEREVVEDAGITIIAKKAP